MPFVQTRTRATSCTSPSGASSGQDTLDDGLHDPLSNQELTGYDAKTDDVFAALASAVSAEAADAFTTPPVDQNGYHAISSPEAATTTGHPTSGYAFLGETSQAPSTGSPSLTWDDADLDDPSAVYASPGKAEITDDEEVSAPEPTRPWSPAVETSWRREGKGRWKDTGTLPEAKTRAVALDPNQYGNEEQSAVDFRGTRQWDPVLKTPNAIVGHTSTRYFRGDEARASQLQVKDGLVHQGGAPLDTRGASGVGTWGSRGSDRHIYAMGQSTARSAPAWDKHEEQVMDQPKDILGRDKVHLKFVNHSSLLSGGSATAAGDLMAEKGRLKLISDKSGHYKPDNTMLHSAVRKFTDHGVQPEGMTVELGNKHSSATGLKNGDLQASALEFQSYGGNPMAEGFMRQARSDRSAVMSGIHNHHPIGFRRVPTNDRSGAVGVGRVLPGDRGVVAEKQRSVAALKKRFQG